MEESIQDVLWNLAKALETIGANNKADYLKKLSRYFHSIGNPGLSELNIPGDS